LDTSKTAPSENWVNHYEHRYRIPYPGASAHRRHGIASIFSTSSPTLSSKTV
jgi:hypothetical protein